MLEARLRPCLDGWSDTLEACLDLDSDELEARLDPAGWAAEHRAQEQHGGKRERVRVGSETAERTRMQGT